jgi:2-methylcitrate dehydratase PrpD
MRALQLGTYIATLTYTDLPNSVVHATRRCILDYLSAVIPGGAEAPALALQTALKDDLGHGKSALIPSGIKATPRTAALINGTASHTLEVDDIFRNGIYHPGPPVISAAIAASQLMGSSGTELIAGVVAGYEVSNRIAAAVQPAHYDYWHTTGTVGAFGAAAATSKLVNLTAAQTKHAMSNAATMAAALQQAFRSDAMSKPLHAGRAAETGVLCAQMASAGVTGADDMLEGPRGFGNAMSRNVDWETAFSNLGDDYTITRMTQKNHCCCGHTFAAIDSVLALRTETQLNLGSVKKIHIKSYGKAAEVCGNSDPKTAFEAKFSLAYVVAIAAVTGSVRLAAFSDEWLKNTEIRSLMERVEITVDEKAEAVFPNFRSATVEIDLADGKQLSHHSPTRRGDPDSPLSDEEIEQKFIELTAPVMNSDAQNKVIDKIWTLELQPKWVL